jgi:hypothetical protein
MYHNRIHTYTDTHTHTHTHTSTVSLGSHHSRGQSTPDPAVDTDGEHMHTSITSHHIHHITELTDEVVAGNKAALSDHSNHSRGLLQ